MLWAHQKYVLKIFAVRVFLAVLEMKLQTCPYFIHNANTYQFGFF